MNPGARARGARAGLDPGSGAGLGPGSRSGSGSGPDVAGGDGAVRTWWGEAWVRALEASARDAARLKRGRTYARDGGVDAVRARPGRVTGYVHGSRPRPYRAELRLLVLSDRKWDVFLDAVAARPAYVAALLDREMPRAVADEAESVGVQLLPGPGELLPACSCPDSGRPCKHAAALGYAVGRLLDDDPFALLLMRGREEGELLEELVRRSASREAREAEASRQAVASGEEGRAGPGGEPGPVSADAGGADGRGAERAAGIRLLTVPAREAMATTVRPPLPAPLSAPEAPGEPRPCPDMPGSPSPDTLAFLAADAAHRAYEALATGDGDPLPGLSLWHDTVRLAATHPQLTGRRALSPLFAALARSAGHTARELTRAAAAWRQGGAVGLAVLDEPWDPPAGDFDRARGILAGAGLSLNIRRNHLTHPTRYLQLRYGRDGRWYPYRTDGPDADWWPEGPAADDPLAALSGVPDP